MPIATPPRMHSLNAEEVQRLKDRPPAGPGNKVAFLRSAWGLLEEKEVAELESRIHVVGEQVDGMP